jgi:hypothetical protein
MGNINIVWGRAYGAGTISTTASGVAGFASLTQAQVDQAARMRFTVNTNSANFRYDGGDPTTTAGHTIPTNGTLVLEGNQAIQQFRFIRSGGSDAAVAITLEW